MSLYTIKNRTNRQLNVNLDGTEETKTILVLPPAKVKKAELTPGQYQYVKQTYQKELIVRPLLTK